MYFSVKKGETATQKFLYSSNKMDRNGVSILLHQKTIYQIFFVLMK